jgi:hypothetical protein
MDPRTRRHALLLLAAGVVLGAGIWVFSPWLTGHVEPWDADAPIWQASWLLIAIAGGCTGHTRGPLLVVGYALGQILITINGVIRSEFGALGWLFILGFMAAALVVTRTLVAAQALVMHCWRKLRSTDTGA